MRSRIVFELSFLSPGTPMFLMGEEIAAQKSYTHDGFLQNRENLSGERPGNGAQIFRYYQDIIRLSRQYSSIRSHNIDVLHVNNDVRVIVFKRYTDCQ